MHVGDINSELTLFFTWHSVKEDTWIVTDSRLIWTKAKKYEAYMWVMCGYDGNIQNMGREQVKRAEEYTSC